MWIWILFAALTLISVIILIISFKNDKMTKFWLSFVSMLVCGLLALIHFTCWNNRCPNCEKMMAQPTKYCSDCGYELIVTCTNGHNSSYKKSYCVECGESLAR